MMLLSSQGCPRQLSSAAAVVDSQSLLAWLFLSLPASAAPLAYPDQQSQGSNPERSSRRTRPDQSGYSFYPYISSATLTSIARERASILFCCASSLHCISIIIRLNPSRSSWCWSSVPGFSTPRACTSSTTSVSRAGSAGSSCKQPYQATTHTHYHDDNITCSGGD